MFHLGCSLLTIPLNPIIFMRGSSTTDRQPTSIPSVLAHSPPVSPPGEDLVFDEYMFIQLLSRKTRHHRHHHHPVYNLNIHNDGTEGNTESDVPGYLLCKLLIVT